MKTILRVLVLGSLLAVLIAFPSLARADYDAGQIAVIEDSTGLMLPPGGACDSFLFLNNGLCANHVGQAFYESHGDHYDVLVLYTTQWLNIMQNLPMGFPVQALVSGIGRDDTLGYSLEQFGSKGRLLQVAKMGTLVGLAEVPDNLELLTHEIGHHWMAWSMLDQDDGRGPIGILRGWQADAPNGHWSCWFNARSVMFGGYLTDNGGGSFTDTNLPRKFSQLDQYLMGLRPPEQVALMWYVDVDGSDQGCSEMPGMPGASYNFSGTRVDFSIDDVIRGNGPRVPASSACHLKVAFVLVHPVGFPPSQAEIDKTDRYRQALEDLWPSATDGLGSLDTRLDGCGEGTDTCPGQPSVQ